MNCYCGSQQTFKQCCELIIKGLNNAETPEQLMRSRYSAYAAKIPQYILDTYAAPTRKAQSLGDIAQWAKQTHWLKLTVLTSKNITISQFNSRTNAALPTVHFQALYFDKPHFCLIEEKSRFLVEHEQWRYLDGEIIQHHNLPTPKRNAPCLCLSGKKFKHCCALLDH
ncbi:YchJ family metal-binding protein [Colwellia sp. 1_MG-2023]|uniref:YchJ family protein n=1 Tax=Colwellia sp. 1_MG-2023 TaxID=3062649 RepID=UPI0026E20474|nr:YchJ family metal-binding protein [Colwellia sp. 1_MG-2023]MDO6446090.1 YchJ family metal-binding protein [Colwellia sp. 1_MG-2023]